MPLITIILLNWNGKKDTLECLKSLQDLTYTNLQIVIVDNGSEDGSVISFQNAYPHIPVLQTYENLGFAGGNNVGINWALAKNTDWILLLNNDTKASQDLLEQFLQAAEKNSAKILGAAIYSYDKPDQIEHCGGGWNPVKAEFYSYTQKLIGDSIFTARTVDYVCGAALFMHRSIPETIGLLEPRFFLYWEETDYCYRAKRAGFKIWTAPNAKVWHKISASFVGGKPHMLYFWWRNRLFWIHRNCTPAEKKALYRKRILPDLWKVFRHYCLRSLLYTISRSRDPKRLQKIKGYKASLLGVIDYIRKRYGNCPSWLIKK